MAKELYVRWMTFYTLYDGEGYFDIYKDTSVNKLYIILTAQNYLKYKYLKRSNGSLNDPIRVISSKGSVNILAKDTYYDVTDIFTGAPVYFDTIGNTFNSSLTFGEGDTLDQWYTASGQTASSYPLSINTSTLFNQAPTISGSDTNVGQKTDPFTYAYTVNDTNSTDNLTITEKANGVTIRTITNAVRGQTYTADLTSVWKQMPVNTATTLTITVSDGSLSYTRTITFTRKEDRVVAYFKTASLTPEQVQPEQVLVRVIRTIATNADFKVFVCNNGLDTSPTWEDATSAVLAGEAYTFTNRMKTAENYAVNVKIQVLKNTATSFSYIKALGFSYI